ncbi:hypothetical protein LguiB_001170 [Lonicera macranthoides]
MADGKDNTKKRKGETPSTPAPIVGNTTASTSAADLVGEYEVFLSFRGADTRNVFTDYLYHDLIGAGVRTFRDDNELRIGEKIGAELLSAIKQSKISIPIFSKKYAFSKWCLRELAHMVECRANGGQLIYPIFYDVEPNEVQHCEKGSYKKAFLKHKNDKELDEKTVRQWKAALEIVGDLKGLELKKVTNGREGEFVKKVVEEVLSKLKKNYQHVPKYLVGMDSHIEEMEGLLNSDSNGLRIIGILGMGGLGKTTIAKVIYNKLSEHFKHSCFLEDVREKSEHRNGIDNLETTLLSKILKRKIDSDDKGLYEIKDAVQGKNVFLVLDDVDNMSQIEKLFGDHSWYEARSRIIITTRNEEVLLALERTYQNEGLHELYRCYRPSLMDNNLALQLFSKHAFMRDFPPEDYDALAKKVVSSAGGLPLVLVTLGSLLFIEKDRGLWQKKLEKLQALPPPEVLGRLRISYDALDNAQQQIFLDIACLFSGKDKTNPYYMWDDCKFYPSEGINALVRRSLITVGDDNELWMHDRLRELGEQIICEKYRDEPGKWSRVWRFEDGRDVLETHLGTKNVKLLRLPSSGLGDRERVGGEEFRKLPNLRYLRLGGIDFDGDFKNLLQNLRWLRWKYGPGNCAPTNFHLKNLVVLELYGSDIRDDWGGWSQIKMSNKLKVLILTQCRYFTRIPHLSAFPTLERLDLYGCELLYRLDGLEELKSLKYLSASSCCSLESLPDLSKLTSLQSLDVINCKKLIEIQGLDKLESLENLDMRSIALERLPNLSKLKKLTTFAIECKKLVEIQGLDRLASLEHLDISYCESLQSLPDLSNLEKLTGFQSSGCKKLVEIQGLDRLASLEHLYISWCESLQSLPDLSNLEKLTRFKSSWCKKLVEIQGLDKLASLELLDIGWCESLQSLPDLSNLEKLTRFNSSFCEKLVEIQGLDRLASLEHLGISGCKSLSLPDLSNLENLTRFESRWCEKLIEIQGLDRLASLEHLDISWCESLQSLPDLSNLEKLTRFNSSLCEKLVEIQGLDRLASLERLDISGCKSLQSLPDLSNLEKLTRFESSRCEKLVEIQGLDRLASLEHLDIGGCESLQSLPDLSNLEKLTIFESSRCKKLVEIQGLDRLTSLEHLDISGCESLQSLPDLSKLKKLRDLFISSCDKLTEIQGLHRLESLEILDMHECMSLENSPDFSNLTNLEELDISGCKSLQSLPDLSNLEKLTRFESSRCEKLVEIQGLDRLASLEHLDIGGCESLQSLPDLSNLEKLTIFESSRCKKLVEIQGLDRLTSLEHLDISGCESLQSLPDLSKLKKLRNLFISSCDKLTEIQGLHRLESLEILDMHECMSLENSPDFSNLTNLEELDVSYCVKLTELRGLGELQFLTKLRIIGCESLANLPYLPSTTIHKYSEDKESSYILPIM